MMHNVLRTSGRALAIVLLAASTAAAGPWTAKSGHGQVIFAATYYGTPDPFDAAGRRTPFEHEGRYEKIELNPYVEIGASDRLTLFANFFASQQRFQNRFGRDINQGFGDSELGARYRLSSENRSIIVAVQGLYKAPTGERTGAVRLADGQADVEGRLVVGGSLGRASRPPFWQANAGYRYRHGSPADEFRFEVTSGAYLTKRLMAMAQVSGIRGLRNGGQSEGNHPVLHPDYDLYRAQLSLVVGLTERVRVQTGGFLHAAGRNTGAGGGAMTALWIGF